MKRSMVTLALAVGLTFQATPAQAADIYCPGRPGVVTACNGTGGRDHIWGDGYQQQLWGHGGDDWLEGRGASDRFQGGPGNDYIEGGAGGDVANCGGGFDSFFGGDGHDSAAPDCERFYPGSQ